MPAQVAPETALVFSLTKAGKRSLLGLLKKYRNSFVRFAPMVFFLNGTEKATLDKWLEEHAKTCPNFSNTTANPGHNRYFILTSALTYCFKPSGVGDFCEVKCGCGASVNITDYESF